MLYDPKWQQSPAKNEPWRIVLRQAADLMSKHGLVKHVQVDNAGRVCLHGAISIAATGHAYQGASPYDAQWLAEKAVVRLLQGRGLTEGDGVKSIHSHYGRRDAITYAAAAWNNHPLRTQDEVVEALRSAAEIDQEVLDAV